MNLMLPFVRTPMNILKSGVERFPVLGAAYGAMKGRGARDIAAEQAISIPTAVGSYAAGASMDQETGKTARRFVSNAGGPNALTSNIAFMMGQESRKRNANMPAAAMRGVGGAISAPDPGAIEDKGRYLLNLLTGRENPSLPSGSYPKVLDEVMGSPAAPPASTPSSVPRSLSNIPLRRRGQ